jgi:hypothetical protein
MKNEEKDISMTTIQPQGENLRRAVKWISEERKYGPDRKPVKLIEEACIKFNLTPVDAEYLARFVKGEES